MATTVSWANEGQTPYGVYFYTWEEGGGVWHYHWWTSEGTSYQFFNLTSLPSKTGYRFDGYEALNVNGEYSDIVSADGTMIVRGPRLNENGNVVTARAKWLGVWAVILNHRGGTSELSRIYQNSDSKQWYYDVNQSEPATPPIVTPTLEGSRFLGYYSATSGGTLYITSSGNFTQDFNDLVLLAKKNIYAQWEVVWTQKVTFFTDGATSGTPGIWYNSNTGKMYGDSACTMEITNSITPPTKPGNKFLGYYSAASGGTQYIDESGAFTEDFPAITGNLTFYAHWELKAYVAYLDSNGGTGSPAQIFYKDGWFAEEECLTPISSVQIPSRPGYTFGGFSEGATAIINADGTIAAASIATDVHAAASWTALSYTLAFDYAGGTGSVESKSVTSGVAIGELPTATKTDFIFLGWQIDGVTVTSGTAWNFAADKTAVAKWGHAFGIVTDYFNLGSASLVPVSSNSGEAKPHICAYNATNEATATETGGKWLNPSVTYNVIRTMSLSAVLGKAFAGASGQSGYMITSIEVHTAVGSFPTVTVNGTANEGVDAVKTYQIAIVINANAHAQNLLNAVVGGGELQELTLVATCDPVVCAENNMPCASDVVHGRIEVSAVTGAYNNEVAPTAGGGFTQIGAAKSGSDVEFPYWSVNLRKELT